MGRSPCFSKEGLNRGAWTAREDDILISYISTHGEGRWTNLPREAGLKRGGKSCRLRWLNYLRPNIKRGNISDDEEELIIRLHKLLGNRWALIAGRLPGRTDNEIKNYWSTTLGKKVQYSNPSQLQSQKQLNKSTSKLDKAKIEPSPAVKNEEKQTPENRETHVTRTKARRCTKVFLPQPQHNPEDLSRYSDGAQNPCHLQNHTSNPSSLTAREEDDSASDSLDFDINLIGIKELLDSDMMQLYDGDENNSSHNKYDRENMYSFYTETMVEEWTTDEFVQSNAAPELQPFDSYLNPEEEWFGQ